MFSSPSSKRRRNRKALVRNFYELAEHCEFGTQRDEQIRDRIDLVTVSDAILTGRQTRIEI